MNFKVFKNAVAERFAQMAKNDLLYVTDGSTEEKSMKELMWENYINSFPEGSNPIYKTRTEHDCNCCKNFIRQIGNVVAIVDGELISIWDIKIPNEPAYQVVADAMSALVKSAKVTNVFLTTMRTIGTDHNYDNVMQVHNHFFLNIPAKFVIRQDSIGERLNYYRTGHEGILNSFRDISIETAETIMELINSNSFYRCAEYKFHVDEFIKIARKMKPLSAEKKDLYAWSLVKSTNYGVLTIRSTAIGTLLKKYEETSDIEGSIRMFETSIACPTNYKRPKAIVTEKMISEAKKTIDSLGLTSALQRRMATANDLTVNNVLFVNRSTKSKFKGEVESIFDDMVSSAKTTSAAEIKNVQEIGIADFIENVLPTASSIEVLFENSSVGNLMTLTAPEDPTAGNLFKWNNNFAWSYKGDVADSIKERVKAAGGSVTGELCCRLAWYNNDDLDFHFVRVPRDEIYYYNRYNFGGQLDVDMNAGSYHKDRLPVENIFFGRIKDIPHGEYTLRVNRYNKREVIDVGYDVEIDLLGQIYTFNSNDNATRDVAKIIVNKNGVTIEPIMKAGSRKRTEYGIQTGDFVPVNTIMLSPNHWDQNNVGNKHYFFILDGCKTDTPVRGYYNEYLSNELEKNRKAFELIGSKFLAEPVDDQLSGLGFSETQEAKITVRVTGKTKRIFNVVIK